MFGSLSPRCRHKQPEVNNKAVTPSLYLIVTVAHKQNQTSGSGSWRASSGIGGGGGGISHR